MGDLKKSNVKKTRTKLNIILNVILYVFFAFCLFSLIMTLTATRTSDGAISLFHYQFRLVVSPSMEECDLTDVSSFKIKDIPVRSMVIVEETPDNEIQRDIWYSKLEVGDVLTFRYVYTKQETITHRIVRIVEKPTGGYLIDLAGDNKNDASGVLIQTIDTSETGSPNYVIGKVVGVSIIIGGIMSVLKQPVGLVCIIIIPCAIIILWQISRIVLAFALENKQKKEKEIEELRKQLAELKNDQNEVDKNNEE